MRNEVKKNKIKKLFIIPFKNLVPRSLFFENEERGFRAQANEKRGFRAQGNEERSRVFELGFETFSPHPKKSFFCNNFTHDISSLKLDTYS